jgi:DNA helicase-2/ATP-dependent DNA helicase PcrA
MNIENAIDNQVDDEIFDCLNLDLPKSFFLFAGAGSGKTRSLVNVLVKISKTYGYRLRINRQQVAIITYTNAACDEIKHRLDYDSLFLVSTIHSFVWELIRNYQADIRNWLRIDLSKTIAEIERQQLTGRAGQASIDRANKIISKRKRLANLDQIRKFTYSPNGDNRTRDSLNHTEVISIAAFFLLNKPLMQDILTRKYPFLLIDESQDTKKELINAFFEVQKNNSSHFSLGLFGDTMQRIYSDGDESLGKDLPEDWAKPTKKMNHRSPKRIITLINKIRSGVDGKEQVPRVDNEVGLIRFFIVSHITPDKNNIEKVVAEQMNKITNDPLWLGNDSDIKTLILEHHMAAKRMGFYQLFMSLYEIEQLRTALLDGSLPGITFFSHLILPLIRAKQNNEEFEVARIVKQYSLLFEKRALKSKAAQLEEIKIANNGVLSLLSLWDNGKVPTLIEILRNVAISNLFPIPDSLLPAAVRSASISIKVVDDDVEEEEQDNIINAWDKALAASFTEMAAYTEYVSDKAKFGTHQGVKGLEFPRVMVILDDEDARGFLFSYEKMLGAKGQTEADRKNIAEGKDTSINRTLRLFYVACSRAQKSLAIIAYTANPALVKDNVIRAGWFSSDEVVML